MSGSSTGATQLFDFPLCLPGKWKEWRIHGDQINFMKITHTNDTLITGPTKQNHVQTNGYLLSNFQVVRMDPFVFGIFGLMR